MVDLVLVQLRPSFFPNFREEFIQLISNEFIIDFVISCSLIVNIPGKMEPLDFRHTSCFIPFQVSFVFALLVMKYSFLD